MDIRTLQEALEEVIFVGQAHKVGIFSELYKRNDTADGLAQRMNFNRRALWLLCEALVEMRYLDKVDDYYRVPDSVYERLVNRHGQDYEGDFWQFLLYLIDPWKTLPHVLEKGKPDKRSYRHLSMEDFIRGMDSPWKKRLAPEIVAICLRCCPDAAIAVDIGGAPGTIARELASRDIETIVYDLPVSLDVTREDLSLEKNIKIEDGDATVSLPRGPYDIAFLGNICHGQSPEDNEKIIRMCYEQLSEIGICVVFDNIRGDSYLGARLALHMLTQSEKGDIYTKDQYLCWLEKAGFKNIHEESLSEKAWKLLIGYK